MAICAMMCGFDTWSEITLFAQEREPWFRRWLSLPGGIPSHDTFNRIFATLRIPTHGDRSITFMPITQ